MLRSTKKRQTEPHLLLNDTDHSHNKDTLCSRIGHSVRVEGKDGYIFQQPMNGIRKGGMLKCLLVFIVFIHPFQHVSVTQERIAGRSGTFDVRFSVFYLAANELAHVLRTKIEPMRTWQSRGIGGARITAPLLGAYRHPGCKLAELVVFLEMTCISGK
jgi:hypothetical protein